MGELKTLTPSPWTILIECPKYTISSEYYWLYAASQLVLSQNIHFKLCCSTVFNLKRLVFNNIMVVMADYFV